MLNKTLCLLLLFNPINFCLSQEAPDVETPLGKIRGFWKKSLDGRKYAAFEGIPFAKPPTGDLRFEEPQPIEQWTDILNATQPRTCIQSPMFANFVVQGGDEDCLYLNVFVPTEKLDTQITFDVLVSIHGGAFMIGSGHSMADSACLMDRDLIFVSINYRLGALGFLSTEDDAIPGNNGMKDQVLALRWVKDNIASFGGNPNSVTITGLSAGGASVHLHYFSPMSKGLFVRGISQSGTALDPWVIKEAPLESAKKLGALVGCPDSSTVALKNCLKEKPASLIEENQKHFYGYEIMPFSPFAPVIEKYSPNPFLARDPYLLLKEKQVLDVPWITSITKDEGLLPAGFFATRLEDIDNRWPQIAHYVLDYNYTLPASKREEVAREIKDFYLGAGEHINENNFGKFTQIFTDRLFAIGAEKAAKLQSAANKSPVYYYIFGYGGGENSISKIYSQEKKLDGVGHGEDGIYFYGILLMNKPSERDMKLKNTCQDIFYSYATTGKPSFDGTDDWLPTTDSELVYLNVMDPDNIKLQRRAYSAPNVWSTLGLLEDENVIVKDEL